MKQSRGTHISAGIAESTFADTSLSQFCMDAWSIELSVKYVPISWHAY